MWWINWRQITSVDYQPWKHHKHDKGSSPTSDLVFALQTKGFVVVLHCTDLHVYVRFNAVKYVKQKNVTPFRTQDVCIDSLGPLSISISLSLLFFFYKQIDNRLVCHSWTCQWKSHSISHSAKCQKRIHRHLFPYKCCLYISFFSHQPWAGWRHAIVGLYVVHLCSVVLQKLVLSRLY